MLVFVFIDGESLPPPLVGGGGCRHTASTHKRETSPQKCRMRYFNSTTLVLNFDLVMRLGGEKNFKKLIWFLAIEKSLKILYSKTFEALMALRS